MNSEIHEPPFTVGQRLRNHVKNVISGNGETIPRGSTCRVVRAGRLSSVVVFDILPNRQIAISNDLLATAEPPTTDLRRLPLVDGRPPGSSAEYPLGLGVWEEPHHLVCGACGSHFLHADPSFTTCGLCRSFPGLHHISHRVIGLGVGEVIPRLDMVIHGQSPLDVHHPRGSTADVRPGLLLQLTTEGGRQIMVEPLLVGRSWIHPIAVHRSAIAPITRIWLTHIQ